MGSAMGSAPSRAPWQQLESARSEPPAVVGAAAQPADATPPRHTASPHECTPPLGDTSPVKAAGAVGVPGVPARPPWMGAAPSVAVEGTAVPWPAEEDAAAAVADAATVEVAAEVVTGVTADVVVAAPEA
eukprot:4532336-Prymnesium_polylepis.1